MVMQVEHPQAVSIPTADVAPPPPPAASSRGRRTVLLVVLAIVVVVVLLSAGAGVVIRNHASRAPLVGAPEAESPATTGPPTTLATPISPSGNAAFDVGVTEVARFVEQTRGLPFKEPVKVELVDDAGFDALLLSDFNAGVGDLRKTEVALKALGLVPPSRDLVADVRRSLTAGVIGFYDPKTKALVVRGTDLTPFTRSTLAHELTHALDDQWFGLDRTELEHADDETLFGFQALTEGSATWVEQAWTTSRSAAEQAQARVEGEAFASQSDLSDLPPAVVQIIESPYSLGYEFVVALTARGGTPALDDAFRRPPVSSEQVMHPERYRSGDLPVAVPRPPADAAAVDDNVMGELSLTQVLSASIAPAVARQAGEGWGGDRYVVWRSANGRSCLRADFVSDSPTDSTELESALRSWSRLQPAATVTEPTPGTVRVTSCR